MEPPQLLTGEAHGEAGMKCLGDEVSLCMDDGRVCICRGGKRVTFADEVEVCVFPDWLQQLLLEHEVQRRQGASCAPITGRTKLNKVLRELSNGVDVTLYYPDRWMNKRRLGLLFTEDEGRVICFMEKGQSDIRVTKVPLLSLFDISVCPAKKNRPKTGSRKRKSSSSNNDLLKRTGAAGTSLANAAASGAARRLSFAEKRWPSNDSVASDASCEPSIVSPSSTVTRCCSEPAISQHPQAPRIKMKWRNQFGPVHRIIIEDAKVKDCSMFLEGLMELKQLATANKPVEGPVLGVAQQVMVPVGAVH